jgi:hypothetical protein
VNYLRTSPRPPPVSRLACSKPVESTQPGVRRSALTARMYQSIESDVKRTQRAPILGAFSLISCCSV